MSESPDYLAEMFVEIEGFCSLVTFDSAARSRSYTYCPTDDRIFYGSGGIMRC